MEEGGVIRSDRLRHPLKPLSPRTVQRLLDLSRGMGLIALDWGR